MPKKILIKLIQSDYNKLFGALDKNIKHFVKCTECNFSPEEEGISITGEQEAVDKAEKLVNLLLSLSRKGEKIDGLVIHRLFKMLDEADADEIIDLYQDVVAITAKGKKITPKTINQKRYCRELKNTPVVICTGPAGTGKTYLAVAIASDFYKKGLVDKIILSRPAVEAGEKLGFLPGDMQMKVDPYLRPLYDALEEMFGVERYTELIEKGVIEVAPLAFMRGRTLSRAFVVLDEAQNTTKEQMKMFLTRFGEGSRVVVNGDTTQIDLDRDGSSGLIEASRILKNIDGITVLHLDEDDVVRHEIVQRIVEAYSNNNK